MTPVKPPDTNSKSNVQTPSVAPKAANESGRRALPAGQLVKPGAAGNKQHAQEQQSPAGIPASQPAAASRSSLDGKDKSTADSRISQPAAARKPSLEEKLIPSLPVPVAAPSTANSDNHVTASENSARRTEQAPVAQQPYENGGAVAEKKQPTASFAAEQQRIRELEHQLQEKQRQHDAEVQKMQQALSEKDGSLQALQSQHAAAETATTGLRHELAQQEAEKEEYRQQLLHLEAEHQRLSDANARRNELNSLNTSLQGQVHTLPSSFCIDSCIGEVVHHWIF